MSAISALGEHPESVSREDSRATQSGRILNLLIAARGEWVALPEIAACAAQYNARTFELRRLGFRIENRTKEIDGARHSWFRLVSASVQVNASTSPAARHDADLRIGAAAPPNSTRREREETLPLFPEGAR